MAKLKLKSVQNSTRDNVNLMNIEGIYFDESGNWVDESGNIIDGFINIEGGHDDIYLGTRHIFRVPIKWGSGIIYPPISMGNQSPAVEVEFGEIELINGYNGFDTLSNTSTIIEEWRSPFEVDFHFSYSLSSRTQLYSSTQYGHYYIQFQFIANNSTSLE